MIEVEGLTKSIQTPTHRVDILKGLNFSIPKGQFVAIMGPSGSGKSTLLGLLAGLDTASSGTIRLNGTDITRLEEELSDKLATRQSFIDSAPPAITTSSWPILIFSMALVTASNPEAQLRFTV